MKGSILFYSTSHCSVERGVGTFEQGSRTTASSTARHRARLVPGRSANKDNQQRMKTPTLGMAAVLLLFAGCEKAPPAKAPETTETSENNKSAITPSEVLAEPSEVPQGLAGLRLTKSQADLIKDWMEQHGEAVNPAEFANYVKSILRDDQQAEFEKISRTGGR